MKTPPKITKDQLNTPIYFDECGLEHLEYGTQETAAFFTEMSGQIKEFGENSSYQVGAVYFGIDDDGRTFFLPCVNTIPDKIKAFLNDGEETIAGSHMTAHAELVGMMKLPAFESLSVSCHVPFCPTCIEAVSELSNAEGQTGTVDNLYFDEASLNEADSREKWQQSRQMPIEITRTGQIGLQIINTTSGFVTETVTPAVPKAQKTAKTDNPIEIKELKDITHIDQIDFSALREYAKKYAKTSSIPGNTEAVTMITQNDDGKFYSITAAASYPAGSTPEDQGRYAQRDETNKKKSYQYRLDALKRVKVASKVADINTLGATIICIKIPTAGMLVNAVQYGIDTIITRSKVQMDFDQDRHAVFATFRAAKILEHKLVKNPKPKKNGHQPAAIPEIQLYDRD